MNKTFIVIFTFLGLMTLLSPIYAGGGSVKWTKHFHYPPSTRSTTDGLRTYDVGNEKLPSVTTILGATKSEDSKQSIANWQAKVGMEQATRIRDQAASRDQHAQAS